MGALGTSKILAKLAEEYFLQATHDGGEVRLVLPGLTDRVAEEIHETLISAGIRSFLVVGPGGEPSRERSRIPPVGLTSVRIGSFIATVCPGQLANIQDSIRGSGGALRSLAYSEEWPWIDDAGETFRFADRFQELLISEWTDDPEEKKWFAEFLNEIVIPFTRTSPDRAQLVLEEMLGSFSSSSYPEIADPRYKLLFHCGIPLPESSPPIPSVQSLRKLTDRLCSAVIAKCREEEGARSNAHERIDTIFDEDKVERETIRRALNGLMDGLGQSRKGVTGPLAFTGCWPTDPSLWMALDSSRLSKIFELEEPLDVDLIWEVAAERSVMDVESAKIAMIWGGNLHFSGTYEIPADTFDLYKWSLCLTYRKQVIHEEPISREDKTFAFEIGTADIFTRYKGAQLLRLELRADAKVRHEAKVRVFLCGPDHPGLVVVVPGMEVIYPVPVDDADPPTTRIKANTAREVRLLSWEDQPEIYDVDGNSCKLFSPELQIWHLVQPVDPAAVATTEISHVCSIGNTVANITYETVDLVRGKFTIEDELRVAVTRRGEHSLDELISIFEGKTNTPYQRLGELTSASRRRIAVCLEMEVEDGWKPILIDVTGKHTGNPSNVGGFVKAMGAHSVESFQGVKVPEELGVLITQYAETRLEILEAVRGRIDWSKYSGEHPVYAVSPMFIGSSDSKMDEAIIRYLTAYSELQTTLLSCRGDADWPQLFITTSLDCAVHWDGSPTSNALRLIGPWHPLVIAKRYFIQASLLRRANALPSSQGKTFRHLAALLNNIPGFRWILTVGKMHRTIEGSYVFPTSDPGWHIAVRQDVDTSAVDAGFRSGRDLIDFAHRQFGLEVRGQHGAAASLPVSVSRDYSRAFPEKRSIGIRLRDGYVESDVATAFDRDLVKDETRTKFARALHGGVHLYTSGSPKDFGELEGRLDSVFVYHNDNDEAVYLQNCPDIYVLSTARKMNFCDGAGNQTSPRGHGDGIIFHTPVRWLEEGQSLIPSSVSQEGDVFSDQEREALPRAFSRAVSEIWGAIGSPIATVSELSVPTKLPSPWVVIPGGETDPAALVKYVQDGSDRELQQRALWDYRINISDGDSSYFILSPIRQSFAVAVNGFFNNQDVAKTFIADLGKHGIAIGGEALKSGRRALGVVGLVGAIRLMRNVATKWEQADPTRNLSFILPVDAFESFFGDVSMHGDKDRRRTDILLVCLSLPMTTDEKLTIRAVGVEAKYVSNTYSHARALEAAGQASATVAIFKALVDASLERWGAPERLGLSEIIQFGLRLSNPASGLAADVRREQEAAVLQCILGGRYRNHAGSSQAVVVTTERGMHGAPEFNKLAVGGWFRLNRNHWPGVIESAELEREATSLIAHFGFVRSSPQSEQSVNQGDQKIANPSDDGESRVIGSDQLQTTKDERNINKVAPIFLGTDLDRERIYFDPQRSLEPLDNYNLMITGSSGTGKTQLLKYLICALREQDRKVLLMDFKNDFADDLIFAEQSNLERVFVNFDGLPFNPLIPYPIRHPGTGELFLQPAQHIAGVVSVLARVYGLGVQQQAGVKRAIVEAFEDSGVPVSGKVRFDVRFQYPDLSDVGQRLEMLDQGAYNRLDPLFTLGLFQEEARILSFEAISNRSILCDLSQISSNEIKSALAEFVVLSAHAFFNGREQPGGLAHALVFDEAHRVAKSKFMAQLVRECRAYGVAVLLSSQYPGDIPQDITSSMATKVLHSNGRDTDRIRAITNLIGAGGREAEIAELGPFQAVLENRQYRAPILRTMNYPAFLVWREVCARGKVRESDLEVAGVEFEKLSRANLLGQLERMGLITRTDDEITVV